MKEFILASASPRRSQLLRQIGWKFKVHPSTFRESIIASDPETNVLHNALGKAKQVAGLFPQGLVLGADTIVVHAGKLLGKPQNESDARLTLRQLADDWHDVFTAIALVDACSGQAVSEAVRTRVHMRRITDAELDAYLKTDQPYDKAGAYGIQGMAAMFVDRIDGCYFNVVGLPLSRLVELRRQNSALWC